MNQEINMKLDSIYKTYLNASSKEKEVIKYKFFEEANNYFEVVLAYIFLNEIFNFSYDFSYISIPKRTKLYRIRSYDEKVDFSNKSEWQAPPKQFRKQGRMNTVSKEALYLGSSEEICLKETNIKKSQKYVLGEYEVLEDIKVGGFYGANFNPKVTDCHRKIGMILNAFLIAPIRSDKNDDIFEFLDKFYCNFSMSDLKDPDDIEIYQAIKLPLKFAKIPYFNNCYYDLTNTICEILRKQYSSVIQYSSCYKPFDTNQLLFNDYNLVLYNPGIQNLRFVNYKIKICNDNPNTLEIIKSIVKLER